MPARVVSVPFARVRGVFNPVTWPRDILFHLAIVTGPVTRVYFTASSHCEECALSSMGVGGAIALPGKVVNFLQCIKLLLLKLVGGEFREQSAHEAQPWPVDTTIIVLGESSITGIAGNTNTLSAHLG